MDFQNERKRVSHGFHGEGVILVSKSPGGGQMEKPVQINFYNINQF